MTRRRSTTGRQATKATVHVHGKRNALCQSIMHCALFQDQRSCAASACRHEASSKPTISQHMASKLTSLLVKAVQVRLRGARMKDRAEKHKLLGGPVAFNHATNGRDAAKPQHCQHAKLRATSAPPRSAMPSIGPACTDASYATGPQDCMLAERWRLLAM